MIVGVRGLTGEGQVMEALKQMRLDEAQCERVYDVVRVGRLHPVRSHAVT